MLPVFPKFKSFDIQDREFIQKLLWQYQPRTSEFTFTNLFIWHSYYNYQWSLCNDSLLVIAESNNDCFALQPIGPSPRVAVTQMLLHWLKDKKNIQQPRIERADQRLVAEIEGNGFAIESVRDQFDYVYRCSDLAELSGRKYDAKRNRINGFRRAYDYTYQPITEDLIRPCMELIEMWCTMHRCVDDMNLMGEWDAVAEALAYYTVLQLQGGVIKVQNKVKAFTMAEQLNKDTVVVHIEKASPEMHGLYAIINHEFIKQNGCNVTWVNREQDLGDPGLRKAKISYHPQHLEEKFRLTLDV